MVDFKEMMKDSAPEMQGQTFEDYDRMLEKIVLSAKFSGVEINQVMSGFPTNFQEFSIVRLKSFSISSENERSVVMVHDIEVLALADGLVKPPPSTQPAQTPQFDNPSPTTQECSADSNLPRRTVLEAPFNERSRNRAVNAIPVNGPCCVCETAGKFRCSHCKLRIYCSKTCQLIDWRTHQNDCDAILQALQAEKSTFHLLDQCSVCDNDVLSRIIGWVPMCQRCYIQRGEAYFSPEPNLDYLRVSEYFKYKKCQRSCLNCSNTTLVVLRDEVLDDWLVCFTCSKMKQLLRIWNPLTSSHIVSIDPPIVMYDEGIIEEVSFEAAIKIAVYV